LTDAGFAAFSGLDGDFTTAFLAARRVADLAERDPDALCAGAVTALENLLVRNAHARQTQARILYRDAAGVLASLLARGPEPLATAARQALARALEVPGKPRLAAAEAVGGLPLPILSGPQLALPEPEAVPIPFDSLLARTGATVGKPQPAGRSLLVPTRYPDTVLVIKRLRRDEDPLCLVREAVWMRHCATLDFPAPCHVPTPYCPTGALLWAVRDAPLPAASLDPAGRCLVSLARAAYFAYPNAPQAEGGPDADAFAEAMARSALLLGWLAGQEGIVHEAAIPLFHNRVQQGRREDGGVYDWRLPGRLDRWLQSALHPNFGLSGLRDFEHLVPLGGRNPRLYRWLGDHCLSLFLVAGSYFRMRNPGLCGHGPDGRPVDARHLFDEALLARVLTEVFCRYHEGFVGETPRRVPFDAAALAGRMVEEMGVDRHMTELLRVADQEAMTDEDFWAFLTSRGMDAAAARQARRGEADVALETGPHLGAFNNRTSLPEMNEAVAAAVAACLAARHARERAR